MSDNMSEISILNEVLPCGGGTTSPLQRIEKFGFGLFDTKHQTNVTISLENAHEYNPYKY